MKAILLAAGIGKRLRPFTEHSPKCLINMGGRPLLDRYLEALQAAGITEAVMVVGHRKEKIVERFGERVGNLSIRYVENPDFHLGSLLSLYAARSSFTDDLLIMDADVLFPKRFLSLLIGSPHPNAFLLDETSKSEGEERMLLVRGGRVVNSTKNPTPPYDLIGEGVGFFKLSKEAVPVLIQILEKFALTAPEIEYEETFSTLFRSIDAGYETVGGLPWIEIDFPEDIEQAEREILPRIEALEKGC
ncbi:MAG TPA: phosphocholine cytidylyltransferase family protein [Nitrospiria bacterium]|nr:phosphocholine cytidylyltransferase family protein [Nitrospiria bacterium]